VSEASGGSDVAALKTTARKDGSDYVITGSKMWITNAAQADWLCTLVNTSEGAVHANKTLVIIPTKTKGVTIGAKIDKLGMRAVEDYVAGSDVTLMASMAKLRGGRLVREIADSCLQYWGGMGFTWDNIAARAYRDTRLLSIGGGADEIMLGIICKLIGILPGKK